jgi:acetolactate synthase-1/2/3 large subunit
MNGAECLVHTLVDGGVDACFANPGTSEMHFVAALDRIEGMRCVLGLAEGVVTGAADGFYRMADRPAATLLHLGPGLANGLANLHNAKKARSGVVNVVGDHATTHLALDAPLTSDIAALAAPMSHWVRSARSGDTLAADGLEAIRQASARPGRIATLILPADIAWTPLARAAGAPVAVVERPGTAPLDARAVARAASAVRHGESTLLLLGDRALRDEASRIAARIAAATNCGLRADFFCARIQRGAGRAIVPRLPYAVDPLVAQLARYDRIVLVGAKAPVAFFAYPGKPGVVSKPGCDIVELASPAHDPVEALLALADAIGAVGTPGTASGTMAERAPRPTFDGALDSPGIASVLTALIPEDAIVVDESLTTGRAFDAATVGAAPHDWLTGTGGSIGFGLPVAVGAAIAAPGRKVIALEGDGSAMYTAQALWTMARESLDVTTVVFANRTYKILLGEFANVGAGTPGQRASDMLSIDRPALDWTALANGMGVEAVRVDDLPSLAVQLERALAAAGPRLIEVVL